MAHQQVVIFDFGSQYTQLIARRVRELNVYCEIHPFSHQMALDENVAGIILSGSPCSVTDADSPSFDLSPFVGKVPILGVCYGGQLIAHLEGGTVTPAQHREYGRARLTHMEAGEPLVAGLDPATQVWMSHGDTVTKLPKDYHVIASTDDVKVAAFRHKEKQIYGTQFHPEVSHSVQGLNLIRNFLYDICGLKGDWTRAAFVEESVAALQKQLGDDHVVLGLSGGVDSSVAALLLHKAIGERLHCIFVDNGLLRKNEFEEVLDSYEGMGLNVVGVDAKAAFYKALEGQTDPEDKRKAIGRTFIEVFDKEAKRITNVKWLGQGTIYPDVIESVSVNGPSVTIKSHHNVGGLPAHMDLKVVEPLRMLFKDEVREVGAEVGLAENIRGRHPFPGPGMGIRILGEVTAERVALLQEADYVFIQGLHDAGLYSEVWQAGTILLPVQSVGVMGDERTYENAVALRAVTSRDGMTADWAHLPYEFLSSVSTKIINQVRGVNRVVYDISSKPPATIEWE